MNWRGAEKKILEKLRKFAAATPKLSAGLKGVNQELKAEPSSVNQQENYERHHSPNFSPNSSWVSSGFFSFLPTPKNRLPTSHTNVPGIGGKKAIILRGMTTI